MKAMILKRIHNLKISRKPLEFADMPEPEVNEHDLKIKLKTCGVCHTELDEIEGRTPPPAFPIIPGHQAVGRVVEIGKNVTQFRIGDRVGMAWIYASCLKCVYCREGNENLCRDFKATGRDADGGYAEFAKISEDFAFKIPDAFTDAQAAPLLCAGAIGYRSLRLTNLTDGGNLGLTGFGASAHLVLKLAQHLYPSSRIFVFARSPKEREFAKEIGAAWSGATESEPPEKLDAVIDTTPVWKPIVEALVHLKPGGRMVINAIRKEDSDRDYLMRINYAMHLWMEKEIKSVANVSRQDVSKFLDIAAKIGIEPEYQEFDLMNANEALMELKTRKIRGGKVLRIS